MISISLYGSVVEVISESTKTDKMEDIFGTKSVSFIQPFNFLRKYSNE